MDNPLEPTEPLDIRDGVIHYTIYSQEGTLTEMTCEDTRSNRLFVVWLRKFDRS